jgi:hypothetical protein
LALAYSRRKHILPWSLQLSLSQASPALELHSRYTPVGVLRCIPQRVAPTRTGFVVHPFRTSPRASPPLEFHFACTMWTHPQGLPSTRTSFLARQPGASRGLYPLLSLPSELRLGLPWSLTRKTRKICESSITPLIPRNLYREKYLGRKSSYRNCPAYPQLIQTTRLVYSLQDRGSQLSRMQRIYPNAW